MFNTITKFTLIGLATVAISSCSSDIEHAERHPLSSKFLKVSGNVNALSRATSNSWESGDKIGITGGDYKNVAYTTTGGTSTFTAVNSEEAIKIEPDATTEFRAYYPFNDDTTGKIEIPFNVVDQEGNYTSNPSSIDFMFAKSNASNGAIEFDFSHSLSNIKLTLVVKYIDENGVAIEKPAEMESVTATDITIAGITTTGSFNTTNGAVITGGESGSIKTRITTDGTSIIVPEQILTDDLVITTTFGDKQHKANIRPELKPGYQYSYTLTYNVKIEPAQPTKTTMSISQSSISPWTEGTGGNVDFVSPDGAAGSDPGVTPELPVKVAAVGDYILKDGSILPFAEYNASRKNDVAAVVYYVAKNSNELTDLGFPYPNGLAIALRNTDEDIAFSQTNGATLTYLIKYMTKI